MSIAKYNRLHQFIAVGAVLTFANFSIYQDGQIKELENHLKLAEMRSTINTEFVDELLMARVNDIYSISEDQLVSQGRIEGVVTYLNGDSTQYVNEMWHEGYQRGLSQNEYAYESISQKQYDKGYNDAARKAFGLGASLELINSSPREVIDEAIKTPEFDNNSSSLEDTTELQERLNRVINDDGK